MWYVYVYLDPRKPGHFCYNDFCSFLHEPFYVGKGSGDRSRHHLWGVNNEKEYLPNPHKTYKIRNILEEAKEEPYIVILKHFKKEQSSLDFERFFVTCIGRADLHTGPLTNLNGGGGGFFHPSLEDRKEKSKRMKGKGNPFYGKKHSEETKQMISETKIKNKSSSWNKGIPRSEEVKEKLRRPRPTMVGDLNPSKRPGVRLKISKTKIGELNPRAKLWRIQKGKEIVEFRGGIRGFCEDNGFSYERLKRGTVPGWEILK